MEKEIDEKRGRKFYLLGTNKDGIKYWLVEPEWKHGWYWDFGRVVTYPNNDKPSLATYIDTHRCVKRFYRKWWGGDNSILKQTPFTEKELWELADLFSSYNTLEEATGIFYRGNSNYADKVGLSLKHERLYKQLNTVTIPAIISRIIKIVSGENYKYPKIQLPKI